MKWNLSDPKQARAFLKALRLGPKRIGIKAFVDTHGRSIPIDEASDEQVLQVASELALLNVNDKGPAH